jgi:hypothetical protein
LPALFFLLGPQRLPPSRLGWRESLKKYFGFDPMIDSFGQEIRWVERDRVSRVCLLRTEAIRRSMLSATLTAPDYPAD